MKRKLLIAGMAFLVLFTSCSTNYKVMYQMESKNTGTLTLKPTKPTDKTYVTVNDNLVIDKKSGVKSVTIVNLPEGKHNVTYSSESSNLKSPLNEQMEVDIQTGKTSTKVVSVPPMSGGYWAYLILLAAVPWIIIYAN